MFDTDAGDQVWNFPVRGFEMLLEETTVPTGAEGRVPLNTASAIENAANASMNAQQKQAVDAYTLVEAGLEEGFSWTITDYTDLVAQPAYQKTFEAHRSPGKLGQMQEDWASGMKPPGVVYYQLAHGMKQDERDALMDALGVQGLAVASVSISGDDQGVSVGGVGTSRVKPKTLVMVRLYVKGEKKPVWKGSAVGKKTETAIRGDMGYHQGDNGPILLESIEKGMAKFKEKYAAE